MMKISRKVLTTAIAAGVGLAVVSSTSSAYANWLARCQTRSGLGYAQACGVTPPAARAACFQRVPDFSPILLSLSTSNCQP